jgi:thioredoxin 1
MTVIEIKTEIGFAEVLKSTGLVVVDFYASWCQPCKVLHKTLEEMARMYPTVRFYRLNVDVLPKICNKYNISKLPTLIFFRNQPVDRIEGLDVERITRALKKHM